MGRKELLSNSLSVYEPLKKYACFLQDNCFVEVVEAEISRNKDSSLICKILGPQKEQKLRPFFTQVVQGLFDILCNDDPIQAGIERLQLWSENKLPHISRENIEIYDLLEGFHNRKQTLVSFLPAYSREIEEVLSVVKGIESFYAIMEVESHKILHQIHQTREQELYQAMEIAQIGSYTWELEKDVFTVTPQLYKIFGLPNNDQPNLNTFIRVVHPDDQQRFTSSIQEAIENQWPLDIEYRIIRNGGEERILWGKGKTTYENGKPVLMQGTVLDVTEKRLTELEVQYREAQLVEAQAIARIGSFDWDFLNNRSTCTAELYRIFGWPAEQELNFRTFEELSHPDDLQKVFMALHNAMENKAPYNCEYRIIRPDKSQRWVWARGKVTFDSNGNGIRLTGTVLDITERKISEEEINQKNKAITLTYKKLEKAQAQLKDVNQQLEQRVKARTRDLEQSILNQRKSARELRLKNEQLERTNAELDNFIYTASHDLKAPILNIEGLMNMLSGMLDENNPKLLKIVGLINTSVNRFKETIRQLTEISKVQKDSQQEVEELRIPELLNDALFDIRHTLEENEARIETEFETEIISFSRKNMRSILYNLVSNAVKYRSPDRRPYIYINTQKETDFIILTVKDNGLGIPSNKLDKVFTMFKRFHTHVEGSGVGLYIVKKIIDNSGGKIEVASREGQGTSFRLYFKN